MISAAWLNQEATIDLEGHLHPFVVTGSVKSKHGHRPGSGNPELEDVEMLEKVRGNVGAI